MKKVRMKFAPLGAWALASWERKQRKVDPMGSWERMSWRGKSQAPTKKTHIPVQDYVIKRIEDKHRRNAENNVKKLARMESSFHNQYCGSVTGCSNTYSVDSSQDAPKSTKPIVSAMEFASELEDLRDELYPK